MMRALKVPMVIILCAGMLSAAEKQVNYYAHAAVADKYGVIAPWYKGLNGQFDYRVRIAAETLKLYPWATPPKAVAPAPEYIYNGLWSIDDEGNIRAVPPASQWDNGDVGQRAAVILAGLIDYYGYSGDAAVLPHLTATADYLIGHCQTPARHGWPGILISVPTSGTFYGDCQVGTSDVFESPESKIQLDLVAQAGLELVRAYELTGNTRWYETAKHWGDLLAANRNRDPLAAPWGRYANNAGGNGMHGVQTGGAARILSLLDELIRLGYRGNDNALVAARDAGRAYLRDVLLPAWTVADTWGRNYWDWECPVQDVNSTDFAVSYLLDNKDDFTNWKSDVRNILGLFINHASVSPLSNGDVYHGAWAYPESSGCCGRVLWAPPLDVAGLFGRYGVEADSEWAREIARRSQILATYDPLPTGQSMDLIDGGVYVNKDWFKIAHPVPLAYLLVHMGWQPEVLGANRENHLMRSTRVVNRVYYGKGQIDYSTFDAPTRTIDVLRLAFVPAGITANGVPLAQRNDLTSIGYTVRSLVNGDAIVSIRHDGAREIAVRGPDPQTEVEQKQLRFEGNWNEGTHSDDKAGRVRVAFATGSALTYSFIGNQVRLVGCVGERGGFADVYLDDAKQLAPIDFYSAIPIHRQILYYRNGLADGPHTIKVVVRGAHNPLSKGDEVYVAGMQSSDATSSSGFGEGGGPRDTQRLIFGYAGRTDYIDSQGNSWRPGTEFIARTGDLTDVVAKTWWSVRQAVFVREQTDAGSLRFAKDQELYRYGIHWKDFTVNLTVGPGTYHVRLKFAEQQCSGPRQRAMTIYINDQKMVEGFDVFATAGAADQVADLVYNAIQPQNGVIAIRFTGESIEGRPTEAMVQAIEVGPGDGGSGSAPKTLYCQQCQ